MIDYRVVKDWRFDEVELTITERDCMLYALGIGLGSDPLDPRQLQFVYEQDLRAVPSMAAVLGAPGAWWRDPRTGADATRLLHGEQHLRWLAPLPVGGQVRVSNRVESLSDKGVGKGALGVVLREIVDARTGQLLAQSRNVSVLRGDGGFSEGDGRTDPVPTALAPLPERAADLDLTLASLPQAALLYRLSGDYNPLHADPAAAKAAGFERPILHGLATYGMACHALLKACLDYRPERLRVFGVRFSAPVYPGEAVRFEIWREGEQQLRLRAQVDARKTVVLSHGLAEIAPQ